MKILDAGHSYELDVLDGAPLQQLHFVKRVGENFPFNKGSHGGTNCQEVLRALIDRTEYLLKQKPCMETEGALGCLKAALAFYELRAARRHGRLLDLIHLDALSYSVTCSHCKHIGCEGACTLKE